MTLDDLRWHEKSWKANWPCSSPHQYKKCDLQLLDPCWLLLQFAAHVAGVKRILLSSDMWHRRHSCTSIGLVRLGWTEHCCHITLAFAAVSEWAGCGCYRLWLWSWCWPHSTRLQSKYSASSPAVSWQKQSIVEWSDEFITDSGTNKYVPGREQCTVTLIDTHARLSLLQRSKWWGSLRALQISLHLIPPRNCCTVSTLWPNKSRRWRKRCSPSASVRSGTSSCLRDVRLAGISPWKLWRTSCGRSTGKSPTVRMLYTAS